MTDLIFSGCVVICEHGLWCLAGIGVLTSLTPKNETVRPSQLDHELLSIPGPTFNWRNSYSANCLVRKVVSRSRKGPAIRLWRAGHKNQLGVKCYQSAQLTPNGKKLTQMVLTCLCFVRDLHREPLKSVCRPAALGPAEVVRRWARPDWFLSLTFGLTHHFPSIALMAAVI